MLAKAKGIEVSVSPNPAKEWIALDYKLPSSESTATLFIYDSKNVLLETVRINGQQGQYVWNCSTFTSGVYYYTLKMDKTVLSGKMIIIK